MKFFVETCVLLVTIGLAHARPGHGGYDFQASGSMGHGPAIQGQVNHGFDNGVNAGAHFQSYDSRHFASGGSVGYNHQVNDNFNVHGQAGVDRNYDGNIQTNYNVGAQKKFDNGALSGEAHAQSYDNRHHAVGGSVDYSHNINDNFQVYGKAGADRDFSGKTQQNVQVGVNGKW